MTQVLFIYEKDGAYQVLSYEDALKVSKDFKDWELTATIDPIIFIHYLVTNEDKEILESVKSLKKNEKKN